MKDEDDFGWGEEPVSKAMPSYAGSNPMSGGPHKVIGAKKEEEDDDFNWGVTTSNDKKATGGYAAFGANRSFKGKKNDEDDDLGGILDNLEVERGLKKKEDLEAERKKKEEEKKTPRGLGQKGKSFAVGTNETEFDDIEEN